MAAQPRLITNFKTIPYKDDIPEGYRLLSGKEFLTNRVACVRIMHQWGICLLSDGKCDGSGYNAKFTALSRDRREKSCATNESIGEMLIGLDEGGPDLTEFHSEVMRRYKDEASRRDVSAIVNTFLEYQEEGYKPSVLVTSCPGDSHGEVHTRVKESCKSQGAGFASVQFEDEGQAKNWKKLWKLRVENSICSRLAEKGAKGTVLVVKIDGGGECSKVERQSSITSQWWINWIKRLGGDVFGIQHNNKPTSPICPRPNCVFVHIGQVVVPEESFTSFTYASGQKLAPVKTDEGYHFVLHSLVLNGESRYWVLISTPFVLEGGQWSRLDSKINSSCGTY